jgi:pullulanase
MLTDSILMISSISFEKQTDRLSHYPFYHGHDLGMTYSPQQSFFRIWAPTAEEAQLIIYEEGEGGTPVYTIGMEKSEDGTWVISLDGDWKSRFYAFRVRINEVWMEEVTDPYAKCVGVNGKRAMVVDLSRTNPPGWETDKSPVFASKTDAVIYELHIRDASIAANSGIVHKGKYMGLAEKGTVNDEGLSTGLDHLKELGVTHIQLLPFYDFLSIDESWSEKPQYNWGYDPLNYNAPEGSYSTNPYDGISRIRELKAMIKAFHENGLRVVMDVTFNHTIDAGNSSFNQLVPEYFYRHTPEGRLSDATACGNETASERSMMRKFMMESVLYWVKEYHIDGFRFDLMGAHDLMTMNAISKELHKVKPDILLYGEGWIPGVSALPDSMRATKTNAAHLVRIAVFSDDIRDAIRGNVFNTTDRGFVSDKAAMEESIKFGVVASCPHPQIDYNKVIYSKAPYASGPAGTINYCECHDNHVLWDKLRLSAIYASEAQQREMHKLALSIILTSQGIPLLHAGGEFLRSKRGHENSYKAGDSINAIDWALKTKNKDVFDYVKAFISIRKEHPAFRMKTAEQIQHNIWFETDMPGGVVGFTLDGVSMRDDWRRIRVYYNGSSSRFTLTLDAKNWRTAVINNTIANGESARNQVTLEPYSCTILYLVISWI